MYIIYVSVIRLFSLRFYSVCVCVCWRRRQRAVADKVRAKSSCGESEALCAALSVAVAEQKLEP